MTKRPSPAARTAERPVPGDRRRAIRGATSLFVLLAACRAPARLAPDADLVPCPLTERANAILAHVVEDCGSADGRWRHDLGPGCPRIWAVRFGLTAGLRRDRDDLLELARVTAAREGPTPAT